jgi:PBSX family phage terminase large subunit
MNFTEKQVEYIQSAFRRWNIKTGATRSGKTWLDQNYIIPARIRQVKKLSGLNVILGYTKGTITRNIIEPMQEIWSDTLVSDIGSDNTAYMFGEKVHCLGAEKITAMNRLRGSSIKYLYADEFVTYNKDAFDLLKSRLDKEYSKADLTCNPDSPNHWGKQFIDSDIDKYVQEYTLFDNPHLPKSFVDNLCREYAGSVNYDRYILGKWVRAEGLCFPSFRPDNILTKEPDNILYVNIGADIGGNGSATVYSAVGFFKPKDRPLSICLLDELYDKKNESTESILSEFREFATRCKRRWPVAVCYVDSAEQLILKSIRNLGLVDTKNSAKYPSVDRIRFADMMYSSKRMFIMSSCKHGIDAVQSAVWDTKADKDTRLDDGSTDIDSLDAFEYGYERQMRDMLVFVRG